MNEEIIFKWDGEMIENLSEYIFKKVSRWKVNVAVYCSNSKNF